jgi:hypothetical protein
MLAILVHASCRVPGNCCTDFSHIFIQLQDQSPGDKVDDEFRGVNDNVVVPMAWRRMTALHNVFMARQGHRAR